MKYLLLLTLTLPLPATALNPPEQQGNMVRTICQDCPPEVEFVKAKIAKAMLEEGYKFDDELYNEAEPSHWHDELNSRVEKLTPEQAKQVLLRMSHSGSNYYSTPKRVDNE